MKRSSSRDVSKVQMKQKLIHLQSELSRYKEIAIKYKAVIDSYQEGSHDELIEELKKENQILQQSVESQAAELNEWKQKQVSAEKAETEKEQLLQQIQNLEAELSQTQAQLVEKHQLNDEQATKFIHKLKSKLP